jgi:hypothetical protein
MNMLFTLRYLCVAWFLVLRNSFTLVGFVLTVSKLFYTSLKSILQLIASTVSCFRLGI